MAKQKLPEDVFTPTAVATKDMFERRNEPDKFGNPGLQTRVLESLRQRGLQLRVFGDTGVGKTSLIAFAAEESDMKPLVVQCRSSYDYSDILEQAIRNVQGVKLVSYVKKTQVGGELEGSGGFKFLASIKVKLTGSKGKDRTFEIVEKAPLDLLLELMFEQGYSLLVLDNFHNLRDRPTKAEIAQSMELLADRASISVGIKMVVIGIAEDAQALLDSSESVRRRTADVGVPRMPDDEIRSILETGFGLLDLSISADLVDHLVFYSDGFPFFAHMLGLNVSRASRNEKTASVQPKQLAAGLLRTVNEVDETYAGRVRQAVEVGGKVQPKRRLLDLLAQSNDRTWTCADARRLWRDRFGGDALKLQFIDAAMGALIKEANGRVLTRDESSSPFRYRFDDPHFRPFLRIRSELGGDTDLIQLSQEPANVVDVPEVFPGTLS